MDASRERLGGPVSIRYLPGRGTPVRVFLARIRRGYPGTRRTIDLMGGLIRAGAKDFLVRQHAIDVLLQEAVPEKDYLAEIQALFEWVRDNVRYTRDVAGIEVLHSARRMLELRAGDCDDMTILLGALLESVGHKVRLVITGSDPRRPDHFSHVYLEAQCKDRWIPLDATMPVPVGWEPPVPVRRRFALCRGA